MFVSSWRLEGSEFHAFGPAYEKARSPNLSFSLGVSYRKLLVERSLSRPGRSAVAVIMSSRYAGLQPMCTWCISTHNLYCMRSLIGSPVQASENESDVIPMSRFQRQVWRWRSGLVEVDRLTPEEVLRELSYSSRAWLSRKLTPGLV